MDPGIPSPVFSQVFNTDIGSAPSTDSKANDQEEEDDGDYFNDLLSILNKRS